MVLPLCFDDVRGRDIMMRMIMLVRGIKCELGKAVRLLMCVLELSGSNLETQTILSEVFRCFTQALHAWSVIK
jgi:hypothetical protein